MSAMNASTADLKLTPLIQFWRELQPYHALLEALRERGASPAMAVPSASRPALVSALAGDVRAPILLLTARGDRALTLADEIRIWAPELELHPFPEPASLFYEPTAWGTRTRRERAATMARLIGSRHPGPAPSTDDLSGLIIITTAKSMMTRTIALRQFLAASLVLQIGTEYAPEKLLHLLVGAGYQPVSVVTEQGQFSRRGGILDLWSPAHVGPLRLEFFGDEVESMRSFDPASQRSMEKIDTARITPAREGLPRLYEAEWDAYLPGEHADASQGEPYEPFLEYFLPLMNQGRSSLFEYLPGSTLVIFDDRTAFTETVAELEQQAVDLKAEGRQPEPALPLPYLTQSELSDRAASFRTINLGLLDTGGELDFELGARLQPGPRFGGKLRPLLDHISRQIVNNDIPIVVSRQAPRLAELWQQENGQDPLTRQLPDELGPGDTWFLSGAISEGWILELENTNRLHLITDAEIFGWARPRARRTRRRRVTAPEGSYSDLTEGDFVVHVDYGIGRFRGLVERTIEDLTREYLLVEYSGGGQVYVPVHQADRLTRYVGVEGGPPDLSRLGGAEWSRSKSRAREAVEQVARDLLELYARRHTVEGYAFSPDGEWQRELEASFPYVETEDQREAIELVKEDMQSRRPMDRLICGDAGYGKTEVALRAAFKAVMDGKQVALLVPTTVLAQQHFHTFQERLAAFPVSVEMLSRFLSRSEARQVVERLKRGEVDIVIGTHRLLQEDVEFKDLGLLIIDEEQRFGVTHKEYLKRMRTEVDVLTMTATPIPRTLYMALTGARDISTIQTPPEERLPVQTKVARYDPMLIRRAILREFDRGGQVFFVHNRVQTIPAVLKRLERLVPEVTIAVGHGQMPEGELSKVMDRFTSGEIDVLLCSSIIESGLDIPNANTLIVDHSEMFGLAQLYQLRGRVGRGAARAYAYFLRHSSLQENQDALHRLEVIAENSQLGAGYSISMRDLEMRGAGDILGTRQHGHIQAVGFHLYTRLLADSVRKLRRQVDESPEEPEFVAGAVQHLPVSIELPLSSAIPEWYLPDRDLRLQLYRRMAEVRELGEVERLEAELDDRFGPLPTEVQNLLYQIRIKIAASRADVRAVTLHNKQILIRLPDDLAVSLQVDLGADVRRSKKGLWLRRAGNPNWPNELKDVLEKLGRSTAVLESG